MSGAGVRSAIDGIEVVRRSRPLDYQRGTAATYSPALREVAVRIIAGDTSAEIAKRRGTSLRTVANQVSTIFEKLEVSSRRELAMTYEALVDRHQPEPPNGRGLTSRERQVAELAALGRSNKAIAYELGIAPSTVAVLLGQAAVKLGSTSRSGLVLVSMRPALPARDEGVPRSARTK